MASESDPELLISHTLRICGFVDTDVIADAAGFAADEVEATLRAMEERGHARYREGRMSGWMLTPDGRIAGEQLLAAELDAAGARATVQSGYAAFLELNHDMLGVCTAWQMREVGGEQQVNDHADADYDAGVVGRLAAIDAEVQPICAGLAGALDRFAGYDRRFAASLDKVRNGEVDWFTKPMIDSYHTIWFELHEDFLATLGLDRTSEAT